MSVNHTEVVFSDCIRAMVRNLYPWLTQFWGKSGIAFGGR